MTSSPLDPLATYAAAKRLLARSASKATRATAWSVEEALRVSRSGLYSLSHVIDGLALPALASLSAVNGDLEKSWVATFDGEKPFSQHVSELNDRLCSANRYRWCVEELGRQIFGSARFAGEETLTDNGFYRLQYLPPKAGVPRSEATLFFLAGFIPYGDRIFRFLPEANLFDRYLERGIPVYLMELSGDCHTAASPGKLSFEKLIDMVDELSELAFRHNGARKMVAQGYCGTGIQLASFLAARPQEVEARFNLATLFVTPLDAVKCTIFEDSAAMTPRSVTWGALERWQLYGGQVSGLELWAALDLALKNIFRKTPMGRLATGWRYPAYGRVQKVADLTPQQRFVLASEYWTSIANVERWPLPLDIVRHAMSLYERGVAPDGSLGLRYRGRDVTLKAIASETTLRVVGFYGGLDRLVPAEAGAILGKILGPRYRCVFHPNGAHVGYVCFPHQWNKSLPDPLSPNPVDVILEELARISAA